MGRGLVYNAGDLSHRLPFKLCLGPNVLRQLVFGFLVDIAYGLSGGNLAGEGRHTVCSDFASTRRLEAVLSRSLYFLWIQPLEKTIMELLLYIVSLSAAFLVETPTSERRWIGLLKDIVCRGSLRFEMVSMLTVVLCLNQNTQIYLGQGSKYYIQRTFGSKIQV